MYSPKIREEYIPKIYRIAKAKGTRMTTFVNEIIGRALQEIDVSVNEPVSAYQKRKEKQINETGRNGQRTGKAETPEMGQEGPFINHGDGNR